MKEVKRLDTPQPLDSKDGYGKLVLLACLEKSRNKMEITRFWGLSESSKPFHRSSVGEEISQLENAYFLEKTGNKIYSTLLTRTEFADFLEEEISSISNQNTFKKSFKELKTDFLVLIDEEEVRKHLFSSEVLKSYYGEEKSLDRVRNSFSSLFLDIFFYCVLDVDKRCNRVAIEARNFSKLDKEVLKKSVYDALDAVEDTEKYRDFVQGVEELEWNSTVFNLGTRKQR